MRTIGEHKRALRADMLALRRSQPPEQAAHAAELAQRYLLDSSLWKKTAVVAAYVGVKGELDTALLLNAAWAQGKKLLLPRCRPVNAAASGHITHDVSPALEMATEISAGEAAHAAPLIPEGSMDATASAVSKGTNPAPSPTAATAGLMDFVACAGREELRPARFGLWEPAPTLPVEDILPDLFIVPALAYDRSGNRLGYGGGYYDRFLARAAEGHAVIIGLAFSFQILEHLPAEPWDRPVQALCTERGLLWL